MNSAPATRWPFRQIKPFLDYLRVECGLADNTIMAYRRDLQRFAGYCLDQAFHDPRTVTPVVVQSYARDLSRTHFATSTIARHLVAVKMFFRYHLLTGQIAEDICLAMESPKTWQKLPRVLSREQTVDLITAADRESPLYLRDRALLELLYATGIRASEAAGLCVQDINFQVGYLRCLGKGNKERIVPVHQVALAAVQEYIDTLRGELLKGTHVAHLFVSRTGRPLTRVDIWRLVQKAARRCGMASRVTPHTLRHCFGSHLLQGGADLRFVQEMLGHVDVTTTQIYTHVDQQHLRGMHKKYHPMG